MLVTPREDDPSAVWEFDPDALVSAGWSAATALRRLAAVLGPAATAVRPLVNCGGVFAPPRRPAVPPPGRLAPATLCAVLAALQPPGAVVVDESLTSGSSYWEYLRYGKTISPSSTIQASTHNHKLGITATPTLGAHV
jgi:hypothetical protein